MSLPKWHCRSSQETSGQVGSYWGSRKRQVENNKCRFREPQYVQQILSAWGGPPPRHPRPRHCALGTRTGMPMTGAWLGCMPRGATNGMLKEYAHRNAPCSVKRRACLAGGLAGAAPTQSVHWYHHVVEMHTKSVRGSP
ncbi:MAG: hypothetical protein GFH27_549445n2 [Chloroflexi bacterium AL-W]|nr:hypothetical protein [Chloroflexi bacterium AL-N1]NOK71658.1 hypothetical protein [Chloroflexi bacterium AL-N10]NOK78999.1 hypothetical protein [Chloroflexi bacterium AL-N5]NOK86433.1 hypothetical protein [Chloroflexi bacterium AL-W]NOK93399.1 hypothetical protein [Chloroflexi bacterium AL-N15]